MGEFEKIGLNRSDLLKIRRNIHEYKWKILEVDLKGAKTLIPGLDKVYFKMDGYLHGKRDGELPPAISGWIVLPDGKKVMRAYLKDWLHTSPGYFVDRLISGGLILAVKGTGKYKAALHVDVGIEPMEKWHDEVNRNFAAEGSRITKTLKHMYRPTLREKIAAKLKGYEKFGDYRSDQVGYWAYDYMFVPNKKLLRMLWLIQGYTGIRYRTKDQWKPEQTAKSDEKMFERLQEYGWKLGKTKYTVKSKIDKYGKAKYGKAHEINTLLNVTESRIGMIKAILYQYRRMLGRQNKNRTEQ